MRRTTLLISTLCLVVAVTAMAESPADIIAARKAGYKHVGDLAKSMKDALANGEDVKPFAAAAREIAAWGRKAPSLFPPGTETGGDTHAKPEIWTDRAGFEAAAAKMPVEADKLAAVAETGDKAAFLAQFKALGTTCGNCHQDYRYRL